MPSNTKTLAAEILALSRKRITLLCPQLLQAIYHLEDTPVDLPVEMHTNGTKLFYHPQQVIDLFTQDHDGPARALLHITSHCLMGHLACRQVDDTAVFDVAADVKVHDMVQALCPDLDVVAPCYFRSRSLPLPLFYRSFLQEAKEDENHRAWVLEAGESIAVDRHDLWDLSDKAWQSITLTFYQDITGNAPGVSINGPGRVPGFGPRFGSRAGAWMSDLRATLNLKNRNYHDVLTQFFQSTLTERLSMTDIDPMWYHFGLDYLGDVPLIEPSEEDMVRNFGTLVIAIDTSGSCDGEICVQLLSELSSLMSTLQEMNATGHIVLVQCDTELHQETHITDLSQWSNLVDDFAPEGFGGTDFTPVFELADSLTDVRGLIYLSDGDGPFPGQAPTYPTLFLLTDGDGDCVTEHIPSWVNCVTYNTIL